MTQEAAETKPAATKATAKKTPRPKALTLQQKFIKLREAIPAIVKAKHSEGVEYKFAKISDVYRLLTPAMNEHGVNFDIVAETATRHTPEGDPLYYHYYTMNERGVQRTVWVYEEDLTIRWTNADNPEDILEVTLHAIGTNDGGPDKAKGSALTYCLKYYLFEKFGIDQGEDDPDMKNLTGAAQAQQAQPQAQNQGTTPQNSPAGRNTQQTGKPASNGQTGAQKPLTDAQLSRMYRTKGRQVVVEGRITTRKWQDNDGKHRKAVEVTASRIYFADSNYEGGGTNGNAQQTDAGDGFMSIPDGVDDELPFN